ncbi:MAG: PAS domain-containing protein, partial [Kordiimonas sp.]
SYVTMYAGEEISGHSTSLDLLYTYWSSLASPTRADIKPAKMAKHLDRIVMMDVIQGDDSFNLTVRLIGTYFASYYSEISGKSIESMPNKEAVQRIYQVSAKVVEGREPLLTVAPGFDEQKQYLKAYALYLPLYAEDGEVDKIMVAVDIASMNKKL